MKIQCTKFGLDKVYHLIAGENVALLALIIVIGVILLLGPVTLLEGLYIISLSTLTIAIEKEILDVVIKKSFFDPIDVLFTCMGSIPINILWILINAL